MKLLILLDEVYGPQIKDGCAQISFTKDKFSIGRFGKGLGKYFLDPQPKYGIDCKIYSERMFIFSPRKSVTIYLSQKNT